MDIVKLKNVGGVDHLSGFDHLNRHWFEFWVDCDIEGDSPITCCKCGKSVTVGWMCAESEEIRCEKDVRY